MRFASLFTGVGGFDLAFERAGMECVAQVEIDAKCREVLAAHWPDVPRFEDVHEVSGLDDLGSVDVLVGGFPCQDYSVAGKRGGLAGDRGALWWQFHRLVAECRPRWVVGENVPGLLSSNGGRDFGAIVGSLVELGYGVVWRVLDAQYFGVAQRRRRVFIVGHSGGQPQPEILAFAEGCTGDTPPVRTTGQAAARTLAARVNGGGGLGTDHDLDGGLIAFNWQNAGHEGYAFSADHFGPLDTSQTKAIAFTQNTRDEVRDLHDLAGALAAQPGMKQTTYLATQQSRQRCDYGACKEPVFPNFDSAFCERHQDYPADSPPEPSISFRTNQTSAQGPIHSYGVTDTLAEDHPPAVVTSSVRRLTPLECERLQGFPDNWTAGQSDTQRYRQMGNAVAVPVAEWVGRQLARAS